MKLEDEVEILKIVINNHEESIKCLTDIMNRTYDKWEEDNTFKKHTPSNNKI